MTTLTRDSLSFLPVEDKATLEGLFEATNQGKDKFKIDVETKEIPLLSERLRGKDVDHGDAFLTFTREGGTHSASGKYYPQMIFQNKA